MTRINGLNIKATTSDLKNLEDVDLQSGDVQTEEIQNTETEDTGSSEIQDRIEEANAELSRVLEEYDEYLSDEQRAEIECLLATLRAESAAIDGAGYGVGYNPETGEIEAVNYASREGLAEMGSGWNGGIISTYPDDANRLDQEDGEYMGTIEIEASGDPMNPTAVMFSVDDAFEAEITGGGRIDNVDVRSQGRDLVVTISGTDGSGNEITKSWVIREGTVRPEPMIFNFTQLGHEIHFDASRAYRISDGSYNRYYGVPSGFYIHGTAFNDTIYGSQGDDKIVAWEGDDTIDAMAGNDTVWGDEQYDVGGSCGPDGGRDTIRGGAGNDTLYGGGNIDTRYASDSPSNGNAEAVYEFDGGFIDDSNVTLPPSQEWINAPGWEYDVDSNGMATLRNTGDASNNQLEITLPDGYTMAFGEIGPDGNSLVITFVGEDANGNPQTCQLTIEDFMRGMTGHSPDDILHLTINGSDQSDIIDFSKIQNLESQVININGHAGDDILLAPPSERMTEGLDREDLLHSTGALTELDRGQLILDENEDGYFDAEIDETNRRFTITLNDDNPIPDGVEPTLTLVAPEGYTNGYLSRDPDSGNLLYIMVNPDTKDTIVVEITDSTGLDFSEVVIVNKKIEDLDAAFDPDDGFDNDAIGGAWPLIPISLDVNDYTIDGGAGADLIFAPRGTNFIVDSEDEVIEGTLQDGNGLDNVPPSG